MSSGATVDGVLVQWGERLFSPSNRIVKAAPTPRLDTMTRRKASRIDRHQAPQGWRVENLRVRAWTRLGGV